MTDTDADAVGDSDGASPAQLARRFDEFARAFDDLPLYHAICAGAAGDPEVAALLTSAPRGQARPVLLLAALHDLVLRRSDLPVARWYTSVTGSPLPDGDPWPEVRAACLEHEDELRAVIAVNSTQTNEVGRAAMMAPLIAAASADVAERPVALVELGCSAGLLLNLDRYRIELDGGPGRTVVLGDPGSSVRIVTAVRGEVPADPLPSVVERVGIDAAPVPLDDEDRVRWLEACLWPDQPERIERFRGAVEIGRRHRPPVVAGDMVDDLGPVARSARAAAAATGALDGDFGADDVHLVVTCSWALTYVRRDRRHLIADTLADLASRGRAVTWVSAEPEGAVPGIPGPDRPEKDVSPTVLGIRRWRDGVEVDPQRWGVAHPHGVWFEPSG